MSNLKFLLDENIPRSVKRFLENKGFPVEYVPKGAEDDLVIALAKSKQAILLTRDSDFANQILYPPKEYYGIVVFKIHPPKPDKIVNALSKLLENIKDFKGKLFIVKEDEVIIFKDNNISQPS